MAMRVIVTGSRDLTDSDLVHDALSALWDESEDGHIIVVHGGARGADRFAGAWARLMRRHGVREETHSVDWHQHTTTCPEWDRDGRVCRLAGFRRNQEMVDAGASVVLAFYKADSGNRGTADCVRRAGVAHIPVMSYTQP